MSKRYFIPLALILMLVLAACGSQPTSEPSAAASEEIPSAEASMETMAEEESGDMEAMEGEHDDEAAMDESSAEENMGAMTEGESDDMETTEGDHEDESMGGEDDMAKESEGEEMMELPAWQSLSLTNAATGESFTLGDFQGKTVFVEPMATWCSNCRAQQGEVVEAKAQLGDDVVFVGLSLETDLPPADLAGYTQANGFDWTYAVLSPEILAELVDAFGRSITSAPSTPHFIIRADGSYTELATGIHSAEEIIAEIQEAQG